MVFSCFQHGTNTATQYQAHAHANRAKHPIACGKTEKKTKSNTKKQAAKQTYPCCTDWWCMIVYMKHHGPASQTALHLCVKNVRSCIGQREESYFTFQEARSFLEGWFTILLTTTEICGLIKPKLPIEILAGPKSVSLALLHQEQGNAKVVKSANRRLFSIADCFGSAHPAASS